LVVLLFFVGSPYAEAAWVAEDKFDSYTNGNNLNTSNGGTGWSAAWSGSVGYKIENTSVYQGAEAVEANNVGSDISRALTSTVTSGTLYIAFRLPTTVGYSMADVKTAGSIAARFGLLYTGGSLTAAYWNGSYHSFATGLSGTKWYLFELTLNGNNTFNVRYYDGSTWSALQSNLAYGTNGAIDTVNFTNNGGGDDAFYDYVSPTNPIVPVTASTPSAFAQIYSWF
jgi:hypothetical protein